MQHLGTLIFAILCFNCQFALSAEIHDVTRSGDLESLKSMIVSGTDVNDIDYLQGSPLHIAAVKGHTEVVEFLLQNEADYMSQEFGKSDTPLHWAALGGSTDVINLLLEAGADIDAQNDLQNTPLHIAANSGNVDAALLLIEKGADFTTEDSKGKVAMHLAGVAGSFDVVEVLVNKGAQYELTEFVSPLLKNADLQNGKKQWEAKCGHCHAFEYDNKLIGPSLWNVVGREIGSLSSYKYSDALSRAEGVWDYENLNALVLDGWNFWPGIKMGGVHHGKISITSIKTRADIIAYLRTQSDNSVALPE
jgi:cytochrome c2